MKSGWVTKKLGEVCAFSKDGGNWRNLPYVGLEDIESKTARFTGSTAPKAVQSLTFRFHPGQVLYGRLRPYLQKGLLAKNEGHCSTEIFPIQSVQNLNAKYLLYWLLSDDVTAKIDETCRGARMPRANMNEVLEFPIPIPSLAEQKRIVAKIDAAFEKIDKLKANAEKNLANAKELFQSALDEAMRPRPDWIEKRLGDVCEIERGRSKARPRNLPELYGGPYPFVQTGDIKKANGGTISTFTQTYSEKGLKQSRLWKKGTLCVAIAANIGDSAILGFDACFPDSIVGISPNSMVCLRFINRYFCAMKDHLIEVAPGTAQKKLQFGASD